MSTNSVPKRALILGGGGPVGVAWEIGLLAGFVDAGLDARAADVIIGTSAGSVVGSRIASGAEPRDLLASVRNEVPGDAAGPAPERDMQAAGEAFGLWGGAERMTDERCAEVGAVALGAKTMTETDYLAGFAERTPARWPATPLLVTAVDCESGEQRVFDAKSGVPLPQAVSASCAVPALYPPVTIEGRHYMDGGVRSGTSAELALPFAPDVALIVAPLGSGDRGIHALCRRQIAEEREQLDAAGVLVDVVHMDEATMAAGGANLMDASGRAPAADAGYAQGLRLGAEIAARWSGAASKASAR